MVVTLAGSWNLLDDERSNGSVTFTRELRIVHRQHEIGLGFARVNDLLAAGARVGLGVDGSASNDSSHMLGEARQAMLLTRVKHGADAMTAIDALRLATLGGAQCLAGTTSG